MMRNHTMVQKIISLFLSLSLCTVLFPVVTLAAEPEENPPIYTYAVYYYDDDGTTLLSSEIEDSAEETWSTTVRDAEKDGYALLGWASTVGAAAVEFETGSPLELTGGTGENTAILYAVWQAESTDDAEPCLLALGDSITAGYALEDPDAESFPTLLGTALTFAVINSGVNGMTAADLLAALEAGEYDAALSDASLVTLTIGGNDMMAAVYAYIAENTGYTSEQVQTALAAPMENINVAYQLLRKLNDADFWANIDSGLALTLAAFESDLTAIAGYLRQANPDAVILVATQYNPYQWLGESYVAISDAFETGVTALNAVITAQSEEAGYTVADVAAAFAESGTPLTNADTATLTFDFHPNAAGHAVIAAVMCAAYETAQEDSGGASGDASSGGSSGGGSSGGGSSGGSSSGGGSSGGSGSGSSSASYTVTVSSAEGGTVTSSHSSAARGATVTLTVAPDAGYELDSMAVTNASTDASVTLTEVSDTQYTFTMPAADVTVAASFAAVSGAAAHDCSSEQFADVDDAAWYHEAIDYVVENGLMNGTSDVTFSPDADITRGMMVTILYRLDGEPAVAARSDFSDVSDDTWYANGVAWAVEHGIVFGYGDGLFGADDCITREQLAVILYRYAQYRGHDVSAGEDTNILSYDDAFEISEYAIPAMQWACAEGLIEGLDASTLSPNGSATRAQSAAILMRLLENAAN
ncbi:MAG: S-layer homology domain-containing protein [Oscillospiraceae bacterium]|nr:S-layer homology domain-containing protein [Oscillospiraceae bacterium]